MYYAKKKVYVIGIGYSGIYNIKCGKGGPPTKFIKISKEILNWLSETGGRINLEDESEESDCSSVDLEAVSPSNEKLISPKKVTTSK